MKQYHKILLGLILITFYLWYIWPPKVTQNLELLNEQPIFDQDEVKNDSENIIEDIQELEVIVIDLKGAIANPGIYQMKQGDRIYQLIEKAGGFLNANIDCVNQALVLSDEAQIIIPSNDEVCASTDVSSLQEKENKININSASVTDLTSLPGIGATRAQQIIEYRDSINGFKNIEELKEVSGIGEQTFLKIQDLVTI